MPGHDVNSRAIAYAGGAIALTVAVVIAAVFLLLRHWDLPAGADRARLPYQVVMPGPALQSAPQQDLAQYRNQKHSALPATPAASASTERP